MSRYWMVSKTHSIGYRISGEDGYLYLFAGSIKAQDSAWVGKLSSDFLQSFSVAGDTSFWVTTPSATIRYGISEGRLLERERMDVAIGLPLLLSDSLEVVITHFGGKKSPTYEWRQAGDTLYVPSQPYISKYKGGITFPIQRLLYHSQGQEVAIAPPYTNTLHLIQLGEDGFHLTSQDFPVQDPKKQRWEFYIDRASGDYYGVLLTRDKPSTVHQLDMSAKKAKITGQTYDDVYDIYDGQIYTIAYEKDEISGAPMTCHYLIPFYADDSPTTLLNEVFIH